MVGFGVQTPYVLKTNTSQNKQRSKRGHDSER